MSGTTRPAGDARSWRRTKLVCTIGPATAARVPELLVAGMNVARLNLSHGTPAGHAAQADAVRRASADAGRSVPVLADLSGPKIRIGPLAGGRATLEAGRPFVLHPSGGPRLGDAGAAAVTYRRLARDLEPGDRVLLADGAVELRVLRTEGDVTTEVVRGGTVRSRAGVSLPSARLSAPPLTAKDRRDLPRIAALGAELVALSFVRAAGDVRILRSLLGEDGPRIVAKIETRPAIDDFDAILEVADAVMIARGDLGVEMPFEEVPIIQKQLVARALERGVPSIVATQMLESMIVSPRPTRAEASDVANAVFDRADAIMLSGETAVGAYPILAAEAAARICRLCEAVGEIGCPEPSPGLVRGDAAALAYAAVAIARADPEIVAISCYTRTGRAAQDLAALRPRVPIIAFSPDPRVVAALGIVHGVVARTCVPPPDGEERLDLMAWLLAELQVIHPGSAVVLVASSTEPESGPNLLEVHRLPA
ncbi:MAG TPA: pyruvate kinase [Patescibacteria group bacterium]|nr:pyruvate kinase [Patescibacteria group bacterium]